MNSHKDVALFNHWEHEFVLYHHTSFRFFKITEITLEINKIAKNSWLLLKFALK